MCVCVCVCERERERERESMCESVCMHVYVFEPNNHSLMSVCSLKYVV
jgi:hypothetical protein